MLIDVLVALSLATLFIAAYGDMVGRSRSVLEQVRSRNDVLEVFSDHREEFARLMPYESRSETYLSARHATTTIYAQARWYGNDRIQTDIRIGDGHATTTFVLVRAYPFEHPDDSAGTPICSVDFSVTPAIGTYEFIHGYHVSQPRDMGDQIVVTPVSLPIPPSIPLTDIEVRDDIVYISTDSSHASDPDLFVVDIHAPRDPFLISGLNTGPGLASIAVAGTHVYGVATSRVSQLHIVDMSDMTHPFIQTHYRLPLPEASSTPPLGSAISYDRGMIYLGTEKWEGEEFSRIDVSDPLHPLYRGGVAIDTKVNDIVVRGDRAYVATSDQFSLRSIDLSDPSHLHIVDSFDASGWQRQEGKSLAYFEDMLNLGRTSGGFNIRQDHELFSWASATGTIDSPQASVDISGGVYGVIRDRSRLIVATRQLGAEIQIYEHRLATTTMASVSLPVPPQSMTCDGSNIYVLAMNSPVLYILSFK